LSRDENLVRREAVTLFQVGVSDGELRAGPDRGSAWRPVATPRGVLIVFLGGERNGAYTGWYLNYDHKGKDARVMLVAEPGPGCYWRWSEGPEKKNRGASATPSPARPAGQRPDARLVAHQGRRQIDPDQGGGEGSHVRGSIDDLNDGK